MKKSQQTQEENTLDTNAEEQNDKKLVEREPIDETPFTAIKWESKWYLTLGKYRLTTGLKTLEEVKEQARDASWHRIMQIMQIMIDEDKAKTAAIAKYNESKDKGTN